MTLALVTPYLKVNLPCLCAWLMSRHKDDAKKLHASPDFPAASSFRQLGQDVEGTTDLRPRILGVNE